MSQHNPIALVGKTLDEIRASRAALIETRAEIDRQIKAIDALLPRPRGLCLQFALHTVSEANARDHHHVKARRVQVQRQTTWAQLAASERNPDCYQRPRVVLTRVAARLLDDDNLRSALKAVRDAVAGWLGLDDGPRSPITWSYRQETTKSPLWSVRIEIEEVSP